jgi:molybdopterin-guanine dinucleotide biosynthesis protein A
VVGFVLSGGNGLRLEREKTLGRMGQQGLTKHTIGCHSPVSTNSNRQEQFSLIANVGKRKVGD